MSECNIRGCRNLQTKCVDCGRLVVDRVLKCSEWIDMRNQSPTQSGEILLISDYTGERSGIVCDDLETVLLRATDLSFDQIDWWMPFPSVLK